MRNPAIILTNETHRKEVVMSLWFGKDYALIGKVKSLESIIWSVKTHGRAAIYGPKSKIKKTIQLQTLMQHYPANNSEKFIKDIY